MIETNWLQLEDVDEGPDVGKTMAVVAAVGAFVVVVVVVVDVVAEVEPEWIILKGCHFAIRKNSAFESSYLIKTLYECQHYQDQNCS